MSNRPLKLVMLDQSTPGQEHEAVKDPECAALWAEGWKPIYAWIMVRSTDRNSTDQQYLCIAWGPPREDTVSTGLDDEERQALADLVEGATSHGLALRDSGLAIQQGQARATWLLGGLLLVIALLQIVGIVQAAL